MAHWFVRGLAGGALAYKAKMFSACAFGTSFFGSSYSFGYDSEWMEYLAFIALAAALLILNESLLKHQRTVSPTPASKE